MELESYFDFLAPDDIRVKGTRIGIETILYEYIYRDQSLEAIAARYPSLNHLLRFGQALPRLFLLTTGLVQPGVL
jgi:hypothetical protein